MEQSFSLEKLTEKRITVLGGGRSGLAAARCLVRRGARVFLSDDQALPVQTKHALNTLNVVFEEGAHTQAALQADLLVVSPGIPRESAVLNDARQRHLPVWGELELGYRLCPSKRILALTGTNGKSTTTRLVGALLEARGHDVVVGGNVGTPLCALLEQISPRTWVVLEVSSFQLETTVRFRPHVGVWLNLTPDHLDRHGTLQEYAAIKARLFARQQATDHAVLGPDLRLPPACPAHRHVIRPLPMALPAHQRFNLSAALCAARLADPACGLEDVDWKAIFHHPHCLEFVAAANGVRFFNDSKATNPHAAIGLGSLQALAALCDPVRPPKGHFPRAAGALHRRPPARAPGDLGGAFCRPLGRCIKRPRLAQLSNCKNLARQLRVPGVRSPNLRAGPCRVQLRPVCQLPGPRRRL